MTRCCHGQTSGESVCLPEKTHQAQISKEQLDTLDRYKCPPHGADFHRASLLCGRLLLVVTTRALKRFYIIFNVYHTFMTGRNLMVSAKLGFQVC